MKQLIPLFLFGIILFSFSKISSQNIVPEIINITSSSSEITFDTIPNQIYQIRYKKATNNGSITFTFQAYL